MSFTLMRTKDGKRVPMKMSIWDAFKGAPPPRHRRHECPYCGQIHGPGVKHQQAAVKVEGPTTRKPAETKEQGSEKSKAVEDAATTKPPNEHDFTAEEDAKILELKAENTTWAKIAEALGNGRSKGMVQTRYKQIKPAEGATPATEDKAATEEKKATPAATVTVTVETPDKPAEKLSDKEKKAAKAQKDGEEGLKKQEETKAQAQSNIATDDTNNAKPTFMGLGSNWRSTKPMPTATTAVPLFDRLHHSKPPSPAPPESSTPSDRQRWIAAASKHFDRTGKRITSEQARQMAEGDK